MKDYLVGIFKNSTEFETQEKTITLTSAGLNSNKDIKEYPFGPAMEREGLIAIISGSLDKKVLYNTSIVEVAPSWLSETLLQLLKNGSLTWDDISDKLLIAKGIVIGKVEEPADKNPSDLPFCALVVGHRESSQGAYTAKRKVSEFVFNSEIAEKVSERVNDAGKARVEIVFRDDDSRGRIKLPAKINAKSPDFIVSLHFNAFTSSSTGTEMLYYKGSSKGHKMALIMQKLVVKALALTDRNTQKKIATDRGGHLLKNTAAPCIITEPFFGSNEKDEDTAFANNKEALIKAYVQGINEIAETLF